jgi:hypothetical protein
VNRSNKRDNALVLEKACYENRTRFRLIGSAIIWKYNQSFVRGVRVTEEQAQELKRLQDLMRQAEQRKDETGISNIRREMERLLRPDSSDSPGKR